MADLPFTTALATKPLTTGHCLATSWNGIRPAMITLKRVYEPASPEDGTRILVERLWPRGMKKAALRLDEWTKDVAPSDALRRWFGHDPARWTEFRRRYFAELDRKPGAWETILQASQRRHITLLYSSHDREHNNAVALKQYLEAKGNVVAESLRRNYE